MEDYRLLKLIEEQLKYDKANANKNNHLEDHEIAKSLQEQFNQEVSVEKPSSLTYDTKKKSVDNSKCLTDPSWELIDPTPNIHNLFIAFNQQFFWNKLLAVCVSWSKRMTTCAGICSYQGRGGMCSITLSEPLLKLRPRKDLVETLLHEMIHALLFVTHNNKDRDGHGPEFHKHMHRINGEAGTKITVYHTFHDEVRLYQQHWWKCNGPCQNRKPFYGMVRRAMNRAPGPNDRWWAEHSCTCGGEFIKVKEPEKKTKKNNKENSNPKTVQIKSPNNDIRSFFPVINNSSTPKSLNNPVKMPNKNSQVCDNTKIQNINGFKPGGNGSLDLKNPQSTEIASKIKSVNLFQGIGKVLATNNSAAKAKTCSADYSAVRNHWLDKFDQKRKNDAPIQISPKRIKLVEDVEVYGENAKAKCPSCNAEILIDDLNSHLDLCLQQSTSSFSPPKTIPANSGSIECDICYDFVPSNKLNEHKQMCIQNMSSQLNSSVSKECPICNAALSEDLYDSHVAACIMKGVDNVLQSVKDNENEEKVRCLVCKKQIAKTLLNVHLDGCMTEDIFKNKDEKEAFFDDSFEDEFNKSLERRRKNIQKQNGKMDTSKTVKKAWSLENEDIFLNDYEKESFFDDSVTDKFSKTLEELKNNKEKRSDNTIRPIVIDTDEDDDNDVPISIEECVHCPICQKKVEKNLINVHLDNCLA